MQKYDSLLEKFCTPFFSADPKGIPGQNFSGQGYYPLGWLALLLAICCAVGLPTTLYAADEDDAPVEPGVLIVAVDPDGPAAAAGLVRGDILLAIDDTPVNNLEELTTALAAVDAEAKVTLQIQHGDDVVALDVATGVHNQHAYLGILPHVAPVAFAATSMERFPWSEQAATIQAVPMMPYAGPGTAFTTAPTATNLVILEVAEGSAAAAAGLQVQDVISALDGEAVTDPRALRSHLAKLTPGDTITLTITRAEEAPMDVALTLGEGEKGQALLGVKAGVVVTVDQIGAAGVQIQAMPALPSQAPSMYRWQGIPSQPEPPFYGSQYALPLPFPFWIMPVPGFMVGPGGMEQWTPSQDFMQFQPGAISVFSTQPGQWMAQPALPAQAESITIFQGQSGPWMAQPALPSASFEWSEGVNANGAAEQEAEAYY